MNYCKFARECVNLTSLKLLTLGNSNKFDCAHLIATLSRLWNDNFDT
ncbi:MAG: hypothetical protein LBS50_04830 [Prevotellaceae bacterium]|nr:hypothetical protein [Prevotellaceae bacterium]